MNTDPAPRFLTQAACAEVTERLAKFAIGGGTTASFIQSSWQGNLRWARNRIITSGDVRNTDITVKRVLNGAWGAAGINQLTDPEMDTAVERAERYLMTMSESFYNTLPQVPVREEYPKPDIWSEATYAMQSGERAEAMRPLVKGADAAGMLAAGYIQVSGQGRSVMDDEGLSMYFPYTQAQYTVTVRDPDGTGSGWAGVDWHDWKRIDGPKLSAIALDKCLRSRNPVRIEPGRYTAILEPQAVGDLTVMAFDPGRIALHPFDRKTAEQETEPTVFSQAGGNSRIGQRIFDDRITVATDCMDPELGFPPFSEWGQVYRPQAWVENGTLQQLPHDRDYAVSKLGREDYRATPGAFRMSGGTTTIEQMIETTKRGLLVTRFFNVQIMDRASLQCTGYTRDGLWLIENGKVSKSVYNFRFTESPSFVLNNIEQLGVPQRIFSPNAPIVVPPMKVRDFSFTSLSDAV